MGPILCARIGKDIITLRDVKAGNEATGTPATLFSTTRLLVGEFSPFETCLKECLLKVRPRSLFGIAPVIVIQATAMNEGGLCEVERRILPEVIRCRAAVRGPGLKGGRARCCG